MPRTCFARTIIVALSFFFIFYSISLSAARECRVKIIQHGQEITPVVENEMPAYRLKPDTFKIEVDDSACSPGIFSLKNIAYMEYLRRTPLIISISSFGLAERPEAGDVYWTYTDADPRVTFDDIIKTAPHDGEGAKKVYGELCSKLTYCPTPARAYARHWPFSDPNRMTPRNYAEFKRFLPLSLMTDAAGRKDTIVIYTNVDRVSVPGSKMELNLIKPHFMVLDFQPQSEGKGTTSRPSITEKGVDLRIRLKQGDTFRYDNELVIGIAADVAGNKMKFGSTHFLETSYKVIGTDQNENYKIAMTTEKCRCIVNTNLPRDAKSKLRDTERAFEQVCNLVKKARPVAIIDSTGTIVEMEDMSEIEEGIGKIIPSYGLANKLFGKQQWQELFIKRPGNKIGIGEAWTVARDHPPVPYSWTYKIAKRDSGGVFVTGKLQVSDNVKLDEKNSGSSASPKGIPSMEALSLLLLDTATGMPIYMHTAVKHSSDMTMTVTEQKEGATPRTIGFKWVMDMVASTKRMGDIK